jgi:hypothetical protein
VYKSAGFRERAEAAPLPSAASGRQAWPSIPFIERRFSGVSGSPRGETGRRISQGALIFRPVGGRFMFRETLVMVGDKGCPALGRLG